MATRKTQEDKAGQNSVEVLKFSNVSVPQAEPLVLLTNTGNFQFWGTDNLYPVYLLELYRNSPTHAAIINSKAGFIRGAGLKLKGGKEIKMNINPADSLNEFTGKIIHDYMLFNAFAVEVIYNNFGKPIQYVHVPLHKLRWNMDRNKFWYSENWTYAKFSNTFERWTKESTDSASKLFLYDGYIPSTNLVYPDQGYIQAAKSIMLEAEVQTHNLNNVKNSFAPSTIITFHQGSNISDEQKKATVKSLKDSYTGSAGSKMIVDFQTQDGKDAKVQVIEQADADVYLNTNLDAQNKIMIAHEVTSPELFGVMVPGKLGNSDSEASFEIFRNKYVLPKREDIETALNTLFSNFEPLKDGVEFTDRPLFNTKLDAATKEKIMLINELRAEAGLPELPNGNRMIEQGSPAPAPAQPVATPHQMSKQLIELTELDYEKIADMGGDRADYEFYGEGEFVFSKQDMNRVELKFETEQEIADYILKNKIKDITVPELKTLVRRDLGINVSESELNDTLDNIGKAGLLNIENEDGVVKIKPSGQTSKKVEVMYAYELREGVAGTPIIETTRPFCRRLIQNNKVYTRAEIQRMSGIFGYNIFELGGGFYMDPSTGKATEFCRHRFKGFSVARRSRN